MSEKYDQMAREALRKLAGIAGLGTRQVQELVATVDAALAEPKAGAVPIVVIGDWQELAAEWLEQQAVEQEKANDEYPTHAAAYKEWRDRPLVLRMLAEKVAKAPDPQFTVKRACPPPSWMFPDEPAAPQSKPGESAAGITPEWVIGYFMSDVDPEVAEAVRNAFAEWESTLPKPAEQQGQAVATLRDALRYVGYRDDGDLKTLAELP